MGVCTVSGFSPFQEKVVDLLTEQEKLMETFFAVLLVNEDRVPAEVSDTLAKTFRRYVVVGGGIQKVFLEEFGE